MTGVAEDVVDVVGAGDWKFPGGEDPQAKRPAGNSDRDPDGLRRGWRGAVGWAAWFFATLGLVLLGLVAYTLFGTRVIEQRNQGRLEGSFAEARQEWTDSNEVAQAFAEADTPEERAQLNEFFGGPPAPPPAPPGGAVAQIRIPKIGLERIVVEGVERDNLMNGPGHYPGTSMPGHEGNAAIAGHRTTYGAPFWSLDALAPGDEILITTLEGAFRYIVRGSEVVDPGRGDVVGPTDGAQLTLTTCNPRYSASTRLVVYADLEGDALAGRGTQGQVGAGSGPAGGAPTAALGLAGDPESRAIALKAAAAIFFLWAFTYWATGRWRKRWVFPFALPLLFAACAVMYVFAERAMAAGA